MVSQMFLRYIEQIEHLLNQRYCKKCQKSECSKDTLCLRNNLYKAIYKKYKNSSLFSDIKYDEDDDDKELMQAEARESRILELQQYYKDVQEKKPKGMKLFKDDEIIDENDINTKLEFGRTILHSAVLEGNLELIEDLINQGADITIEDNNGHTPFILAKFEKKKSVLKLFKKLAVNT